MCILLVYEPGSSTSIKMRIIKVHARKMRIKQEKSISNNSINEVERKTFIIFLKQMKIVRHKFYYLSTKENSKIEKLFF